MDRFTEAELITEQKRAARLADLCLLHGQMDGAKAQKAVADACSQELVERNRGKP